MLFPFHQISVAQALDIARETYLAILMDRDSNGPVIVASPEGGMDIEEVAEKYPDKIFKVCKMVVKLCLSPFVQSLNI